MKFESSRQIFEKYSFAKYHECVQWEPSCSTRTDRQTDTSKLIVVFRNFANAPRNSIFCLRSVFLCVLYVSENKQRHLSSKALIDWFCLNRDGESITFIVRLIHSIIHNLEVKIYVV